MGGPAVSVFISAYDIGHVRAAHKSSRVVAGTPDLEFWTIECGH
jgi:hypothetical protein